VKVRVLGEEAREGTDGCDQERCGPCGKAGRTEWARRRAGFLTVSLPRQRRRGHSYSWVLPGLGAVVLKLVEYHFEYHFWVFGRNGGIVRVTLTWRNPLLRHEAKHPETPLSQLD
jgi:hypothetical protein